MRVQGYPAYFKDGILAVKKEINLKEIEIDGVKYEVVSHRQSDFNPKVYNYVLWPIT